MLGSDLGAKQGERSANIWASKIRNFFNHPTTPNGQDPPVISQREKQSFEALYFDSF